MENCLNGLLEAEGGGCNKAALTSVATHSLIHSVLPQTVMGAHPVPSTELAAEVTESEEVTDRGRETRKQIGSTLLMDGVS